MAGRLVRYVDGASELFCRRCIGECFARFTLARGFDGGVSMEQTRVASVLRDACSDELAFMPSAISERARIPSPFALSLVDAAFTAAHARPERYARMREYVLLQYVPGRGADVSEDIGAHRVASVRSCFSLSLLFFRPLAEAAAPRPSAAGSIPRARSSTPWYAATTSSSPSSTPTGGPGASKTTSPSTRPATNYFS